MGYPADYPGRSSLLGGSDLLTAIPSWMTFTRGAGSWSTQTAAAVDGTTFIETGTSQNTSRHHYVSAAGRRLFLIEPTRQNYIGAGAIFVDANVNDIPDGWVAVAGLGGTDFNTVLSVGPAGNAYFQIEDVATANRGVSLIITAAGAATYAISQWSFRSGTAGAGSVFVAFDGATNKTIALTASAYDWTRVSTQFAAAADIVLAYMCASGDPTGIVRVTLPQIEVGAYPSTFVAGTRAAELCAISASKIGATQGYVSFLWSPQYANDAFAGAATLFTWGVNWRLDYDGADDKLKVIINGTARNLSAAQTFAAGALYRISVRYGTGGTELTVNGVTTVDTTAWGSPTIAAFLGSRAASANCESAGYADLVLAA